MRHLLLASVFAVALPAASHAALMSLSPTSNPPSNDGLTYTLIENSISANGLTASFTFTASGYNTASDLQGGVNAGRSGLEAFAFNQPSPSSVVTGAVSTPAGYSFVAGGLNSGGCNMAGNFFCFDDTATPNAPPLAPGTLTFNFTVTANQAGVWANYATDLKVNWVGSANNYDLISQPIPVNIGTPPKVPEPSSLAILGAGLLGLGIAFGFKKRLG